MWFVGGDILTGTLDVL